MSNADKSASEKIFQDNFVREMEKYKWEAPSYLNGNVQKVTVDDLIDNWRRELNRINADQLEGVELTDNEFAQVMAKVNRINNSYEASKILAMENSKGKIDGILRDLNTGVTRKQITLTIFKKAEVRGGDSSYKIAREVCTSKNNRFDIVLLINGLPLINIEQKRTDKSLDEAFGQFKRYYQDGEYCNNFMAFSQMMVINSEIETRYFATPKTINDFNPAFVFHWADKKNKAINNWQKVIEHFLMIPMAHQMVGDYLVIDEAKEEENRRHMVMRPYQVYALQAIEGAAFGWDNPDGLPHGGFVWHTTGSGKTITSFKTALFLSTRAGFDNVIFLVDRRELDSSTSDNFKAYVSYEAGSVDDTSHTYQLKKLLKSPKSGIIITTTFKLNALVKELNEKHDNSLVDKKFVFIIDEAHRTTMGQMMGTIREYFKKNGLFYGFTGTPLFDENNVKGRVNKKSEVINTTEKLFGPELHEYTIEEAIADGNVLGFHVDYINTGEFKSYDDLKERLVESIQIKKPDRAIRDIEKEVEMLSGAELETQAIKNDILRYQDETHIPRVVTEILDNWLKQSQNKEFNAILTVAYKNRVVDYYHEFKKQLALCDLNINIALTFSFGNENSQYLEDTKKDKLDPEVKNEMFKDYSEFTGINFNESNEDLYFEDIVERAKRGGSGRNPKNIDLVIVANQLLTGYDSKRLNTLYVDRSLELQNLIQAYSRTNRVFGNKKEFGTIINFQYPKITEKMVEDALRLYGSGGKNSKVVVDIYDNAVKQLKVYFIELNQILKDPAEWKKIEFDEERKKEFTIAYRKAAEQFNKVQQYYEYKWDEKEFGMEEHEWLKYQGANKNIHRKDADTESTPDEIIPLVGKTKLAGTQVIDANHIIKLIGDKLTSNDGIQTIDSEMLRIVYEQIQELSDIGEYNQAQLLKRFVDEELITGKVSSEINFDDAFENWKNTLIEKEVDSFSKEWGLDFQLLLKSVKLYSLTEPEVIPYITDLINTLNFDQALNKSAGNKLRHNIKMKNELLKWILEMKHQYR